MFGLFRKSQKEAAAGLFLAADEFDKRMVETNFLQLAPGSLAHTRFAVSAHMFAYLMCQNMVVNCAGNDPRRSLEIARLVTEKCIADLASNMPVPVADLIIWQEELEDYRSIKTANDNPPLDELIRELYVARLSRMMRDDMQGLVEYLQRGPSSLAQHLPRARSLIMQTIADEKRASDEETVVDFVISYQMEWLLLHTMTEAALK